MGKSKMIAKSCPKCELQVAVASKSCKCGHAFIRSRQSGSDASLPVSEDIRRRTGRVKRSQPQFYDAQHYQKQKKKSPKKRTLSSSDQNFKDKSESATARARRRRALRRAQREPLQSSGERTRDSTPQLRPAQIARCHLILQEINRKMAAVTWQPPTEA